MPQVSPISLFVKHRSRLGILLIALIASANAFAASDKAMQGEQMLQAAIAKNDIRELPSFEMKASLKLDNYGHPIDGTYSLLWNGPNQWREEINLPGYSEIQVTGKDVASVKRTTQYMPWQINLIHDILGYDQKLKLGENEKVKQIRNREIHGIKVSCVEITGKFGSRQVCTDPSNGALIRELPFVDGKLTTVAEKQFPFSLSYVDHEKILAEATITELKTPVQFSTSEFDPPAGGVSKPKCDGEKIQSGRLVTRVNPTYPSAQRMARVQGTVKLYGVIGTDGMLHGLEVVSSVDPALDSSALQAVQQWRYEPYTCNGVPVEVESVVQVNYSLNPY
jgi:TonB family protein